MASGAGGRRFRRRAAGEQRGPAVPISDALDQYLERAGLKRRLVQASTISDWPELVGPKIAAVTRPEVVLEGGILVVSVKTAAWAQELQMMSPMILEALGSRGKRIKRILWRVTGG